MGLWHGHGSPGMAHAFKIRKIIKQKGSSPSPVHVSPAPIGFHDLDYQANVMGHVKKKCNDWSWSISTNKYKNVHWELLGKVCLRVFGDLELNRVVGLCKKLNKSAEDWLPMLNSHCITIIELFSGRWKRCGSGEEEKRRLDDWCLFSLHKKMWFIDALSPWMMICRIVLPRFPLDEKGKCKSKIVVNHHGVRHVFPTPFPEAKS